MTKTKAKRYNIPLKMSHKNKKENNSVKQHKHCKLRYAFTVASKVMLNRR